MSMPVWATFHYAGVVPANRADFESGHWQLENQSRIFRDRIRTMGGPDAPVGSRLAGLAPTLTITDSGLTPNAGWNQGKWLPSVPRAQLTLLAGGREGATVASASFHIDMGLINSLRPADTIHLVRTGSGGLAISVIRVGILAAAAGAITAVPLGSDLVACYPDVMEAVEALFRKADPTLDWSVLTEVPIEIRNEDQRRIRCRANIELGPYRIFIVHGGYPGIPGTEACAAISRKGAGPEIATISCAQLLDGGEMEIVEW
jgi:hypothetical protein